ncbi:gamma-glutamyl-gamma-aminobutyrate hydrolase family protein [Herbaspirillum rhizosphaerae]|uniref:gamma-glutamyl-gamma-aminobutyrate hydrolase family protein n=1 Tax=Herbaspirillum rhizosphaerae TaxID=346179 RepID=UPI00067DB622|nr:gamma-glutamyl-gamma-aminobutyrate hydrolase family protein [Herbaspirillum rhizosphaerae]
MPLGLSSNSSFAREVARHARDGGDGGDESKRSAPSAYPPLPMAPTSGEVKAAHEDDAIPDVERKPGIVMDAAERQRIDDIFNRRSTSPVTVAISYREAYGYDKRAFVPDEEVKHRPIKKVPPIKLSVDELEVLFRARERVYDKTQGVPEAEVSAADAQQGALARACLMADLAAANGLYIPGGQDRLTLDEERVQELGLDEKLAAELNERDAVTREIHEQAMIRYARNTGLPILAVCGGSRSMARGFSAQEEMLDEDSKKIHQSGLAEQAHGLRFPDVHTILAGAVPKLPVVTPGKWPEGSRAPGVDKVNSTHEKVIALDPQGDVETAAEIKGVKRLPAKKSALPAGNNESELLVSALSLEDGHPEGFETRYGAPMIGVTSHPEAIHGASSRARNKASAQGIAWSDNVLTGFVQSMQTHANKRQLHMDLMDRDAKSRGVTLPREIWPMLRRVGQPPIQFGFSANQSRTSSGARQIDSHGQNIGIRGQAVGAQISSEAKRASLPLTTQESKPVMAAPEASVMLSDEQRHGAAEVMPMFQDWLRIKRESEAKFAEIAGDAELQRKLAEIAKDAELHRKDDASDS